MASHIAGRDVNLNNHFDSIKAGRPAIPCLRIHLEEMHGTCPPKGIYKNIHSTIILNSQKSGNQLSTVMWISGSIFTQWKTTQSRKEWTTATHNNMGGWALEQSTDMKEHILYDSKYVKFKTGKTQLQWQRCNGRDILWKGTRGKLREGWKCSLS